MNKSPSLATLRKLLMISILATALMILFLNFFLMFKGKEILSAKLSQETGRQIQLERVWFKLPFSINIVGMTIDGISPAKEIFIKLGFSNIFRSQFVIKRIVLIESVILLVRDQNGKVGLKGLKKAEADQVVVLPVVSLETNPPQNSKNENKVKQRNKNTRISINQIIFENSTLEFVNERNQSEEDKLKFKQVKLEKFGLRIKDFVWPLESHPMTFRLNGQLSIPDFALNQKTLKSEGWINIVKKDMNSELVIAESESESSLHALFVSNDNDMQVSGNIKMSDFMNKLPQEDKGSKGLDQMIFGALSQMGVQVALDFSFKTKMDQFEVTNVSFTGNVVTKPIPSANKAETVK